MVTAGSLGSSGCFELIKRSEKSGQPWWEAGGGNSPQGQIVQGDTTDSSAPAEVAATADDTLGPATAGESRPQLASAEPAPFRNPDAETGRELAARHGKRDRQHKRVVRKVNEYALWCIENDMWEEARLHLENALAADSSSASLNNNLGVVYERLGERDKAEFAYRRAGSLSPNREAYRANLRRLEGRAQREISHPDEIDSLSAGMDDLGLEVPEKPEGEDPPGRSFEEAVKAGFP